MFKNWLKATFLLLVKIEVIYIDFQDKSLREMPHIEEEYQYFNPTIR